MTVAHLEYVDRALELVERARGHGVELRILGSLAYRLHCPANLALFEEMKRDLTDVDLAARGEQRRAVRELLAETGYKIDQDMLVASEGKRYAFSDPETGMAIDVFFDELFFCHRIPLRDRLDLDYPTITPTDLLLEKMQIVELNPKDVKDSLVLLLEHPLVPDDREGIDSSYVAQLLAGDWGFYYTVTGNLEKLRKQAPEYGALQEGQWTTVEERITALERAIEAEPKSAKWKLRARIGARRKWYQEVAEKSATY
jgi:hypothetical protein